MDSDQAPPLGADAATEQKLEQLVLELQRLQDIVNADVSETPTGALVDCYPEEYTVHTANVCPRTGCHRTNCHAALPSVAFPDSVSRCVYTTRIVMCRTLVRVLRTYKASWHGSLLRRHKHGRGHHNFVKEWA